MIFFLIIPIPLVLASAISPNPRSVNLALETSFLFDPYSDSRHLPLLRNMRSILNTLYEALSPKPNLRAQNDVQKVNINKDGEILTKFLYKLGQVIRNYTDDDLRTIIEVLHEEVESFYEKKKTTYDSMIFNPKLRMYVKNTFKEWRSSNSLDLKLKLVHFLNNIQSYELLQEFNSYFNVDDKVTLRLFLNYFKGFLKTPKVFKLSSLVKDASRFIMFERYDNLSDESKIKVKNAVNKMFENTGRRKNEFTEACHEANKNLSEMSKKLLKCDFSNVVLRM